MSASSDFRNPSSLRKRNKNFLNSERNSFEIVNAFVYQNINVTYNRECEYISYEKALADLKDPSPIHLNQKKFLDKSDNPSKEFIDIVKEEIKDYFTIGHIKDIDLRGRKQKSFTAWMSLRKGKATLEIDGSFLSKTRRKNDLKVTAATLVSDDDIKGLQISVDENGNRMYKLINGTVAMVFNWKTNAKDCRVVVNIAADGEIIFSQTADVSREEVADHSFVKVTISNTDKKDMTLLNMFDDAEMVL
ncbi:uncharacterized protein TNIN_17091 [Trichonephila inaurata madagascariensis]|uniref:Uncharacterized protein n=1 Tax=Trichonephila inaurata madagascariensis TaxID=2747483 RepID=A0A8X6WPW5_9ARAC|nr:uncharacterized protein TNIN_17091 [Trichonephila inaurata madagascariensis]